ncbi:hypothetical protein BSLG_008439 [Batrachochytrium salamandrivorans]|nr:hypothetical protein BSLG_008439 [Batrachochytrium salamandrivorans]
MPRHSKNNTALAFFTSAERSKLTYGTQKQRLGRDSMRDYDACLLCLRAAVQPECLYESILAQKKQILRQNKDIVDFEQSLDAGAATKAEEEHGKKIEAFKLLEANPLSTSTRSANSNPSGNGLTSFWLPSLTPDAAPTAPKVDKSEPLCIAASHPHPVSLKRLIPVIFAQSSSEPSSKKDLTRPAKHCPSCLTSFRNGVKIIVARNCGHALCRSCYVKFMKSCHKCVVCDTKCKERDIIDLDIEGTGFSSGGQAEAKKGGPAFQ